jgi:broad specificity phosphatase PhoE
MSDDKREVIDAVANAIWPLDDLSTDAAREDLRRDVTRGLEAIVTLAQDDDAWVSGHDLCIRVGALVCEAVKR